MRSHAKMKMAKMSIGKQIFINKSHIILPYHHHRRPSLFFINLKHFVNTINVYLCRFYLYKLPGQFKESLTQKNSRYVYITSAAPNQQWTLSKFTLNESSSMAGQTLAQAYYDRTNDVQDRLLIAYNDEPPIGHANEHKGHTKGVLVADAKSGFWLVHSVPLYPNISSKIYSLSLN